MAESTSSSVALSSIIISKALLAAVLPFGKVRLHFSSASYLETKMTGGGFASALLEIKKPATELLKNYEAAFKQNPALIKTADYFEYLSLLYREKKDVVRPELLKYAQEMMAISNDEQKWELANRIYGILNMPEKQKVKTTVYLEIL